MNCCLECLIGGTIDLGKADENDFDYDRVNYPRPVLDKMLSCCEEDKAGPNGFFAYSIRISLAGFRIVNIERIALSLNISGENRVEFKLNGFPSGALEKEALVEVINIMDVNDAFSKPDNGRIIFCIA